MSDFPDWSRILLSPTVPVYVTTEAGDSGTVFTGIDYPVSPPLTIGYHSLILVVTGTGSLAFLTIEGARSGAVWVNEPANALPGPTLPPAVYLFDSTIDNQVTVTWGWSGGPIGVAIYACAATIGSAITNQTDAPAVVSSGIGTGSSVGTTEPIVVGLTSGGIWSYWAGNGANAGLVQQAPIPSLKVATVNQVLAAAGTGTIIAAVAGKTITIYGFNGQLGASAAASAAGIYRAQLSGITSGTIVALGSANLMTSAGLSMAPFGPGWLPGGFPLSLGEGLQCAAGVAAANVEVRGVVYYTQL